MTHNKIKQKQEHTLTDNTQVESITMMVPETQNDTQMSSFTIPEAQKVPELTSAIFWETQKSPDSSLEVPHTPKRPLKPTEQGTTHKFTSFQNIFMKELEVIKDFTKPVERKSEELAKAIIGLSVRNVWNCIESSSSTVEILKKQVSILENLLIEKDAIINSMLKKKRKSWKFSR